MPSGAPKKFGMDSIECRVESSDDPLNITCVGERVRDSANTHNRSFCGMSEMALPLITSPFRDSDKITLTGNGNTESSDLRECDQQSGADISDMDDASQSPSKMRDQFVNTKLCPHFGRGHCNHGTGCTFAHSKDDLRPLPDLQKTKLCESITRGYQCRQRDCTYAHNRDELRATGDLVAYKTSLCFFHKKEKCLNGDKCRFAHGTDELRSRCEAEEEYQHIKHNYSGDRISSPGCPDSEVILASNSKQPVRGFASPHGCRNVHEAFHPRMDVNTGVRCGGSSPLCTADTRPIPCTRMYGRNVYQAPPPPGFGPQHDQDHVICSAANTQLKVPSTEDQDGFAIHVSEKNKSGNKGCVLSPRETKGWKDHVSTPSRFDDEKEIDTEFSGTTSASSIVASPRVQSDSPRTDSDLGCSTLGDGSAFASPPASTEGFGWSPKSFSDLENVAMPILPNPYTPDRLVPGFRSQSRRGKAQKCFTERWEQYDLSQGLNTFQDSQINQVNHMWGGGQASLKNNITPRATWKNSPPTRFRSGHVRPRGGRGGSPVYSGFNTLSNVGGPSQLSHRSVNPSSRKGVDYSTMKPFNCLPAQNTKHPIQDREKLHGPFDCGPLSNPPIGTPNPVKPMSPLRNIARHPLYPLGMRACDDMGLSFVPSPTHRQKNDVPCPPGFVSDALLQATPMSHDELACIQPERYED